jgi:HEAT repeat protein
MSYAHPSLREAAALVLMQIGAPAQSALPALTRALKDPDPLVRAASAMTLGALDSAAKAVVPDLQRMAASDPPNRLIAELALKRLKGAKTP